MISLKRGFNYLTHNQSQFWDSIVKNFLYWLPDRLYLSFRFRCLMGYWIDWKNPKTFTEKLQWLKLYNRQPEYTQMVDKYEVKKLVADCIGDEYVIPTLGVWDSPEAIDWDLLPNQFVLKTTHGGGGGGVVICRDKSSFDKVAAVKKLKASMKSDIYKSLREWPYKNVKKRIIAEQYIHPVTSVVPSNYLADYKFFCFDGEPHFLYVSDSTAHKLIFLKPDWTPADFGRDDYGELDDYPPKPDNLEELLSIVRKLAESKPHVRVDLYVVDHHTYFGEMTFFTGSGFIPFNPQEADGQIGDLLALPVKRGGKFLVKNGNLVIYDSESIDLPDYKFFCFNGKVKFFKVDFGRFVEHHANYYSPDGTLLSFGEAGFPPEPSYPVEIPSNLNKMVSLAERLSEHIHFLRVDFYNINGKIFFGELTFYPASGFFTWTSDEIDRQIGDFIQTI